MADWADPRSIFGPAAERYATSQVHANPAALQRILEVVQPSGGNVLDIATGSGHTALAFAPFVDRVIVTDFTPSMAQVCRSEADKRGLANLSTLVAKAESLPFRSGAFSGVTCRIAPHHFESPTRFVEESRRVLAKSGWFLLIDNVGPEDVDAAKVVDEIERRRDPSHRSYLSANAWRTILKKAGFRIDAEHLAAKSIDIQDWMDRLAVSEPVQADLWERFRSLEGRDAEYLEFDGRAFRLNEQLFLCR